MGAMPIPGFFESRAHIFWPHRWALGIGAFTTHLAVFAGVVLLIESDLPLHVLSFRLLLPLFALAIVWMWGLFLVGVWFDPTRGTMRLGSPWFLRAPRGIQLILRWYASVFLLVWFASPLILLPFLVRW